MAKKIRVRLNWDKRKANKAVEFAAGVYNGMNDNKHFPNPTVTMPVMQKAVQRLLKAHLNRKNGLKAKAEVTKALADINEILMSQAEYVDSIANGDPNIIMSSGFIPTKATSNKYPVPDIPKRPEVKHENGMLCISTDAVEYATSYFWIVFVGDENELNIEDNQIAMKNVGDIVIIPAGNTHEHVKSIPPGKKVTIQVCAQNATGKSALTHPITTYTTRS